MMKPRDPLRSVRNATPVAVDWDGPIPSLDEVFESIAAKEAQATPADPALWGRLRTRNASGVSLEYPVKSVVRPLRKGTVRHRLVHHMRPTGTTVGEVMTLFDVSHAAAVYRLRELHYQGGYGLTTRSGRLFLVGDDA